MSPRRNGSFWPQKHLIQIDYDSSTAFKRAITYIYFIFPLVYIVHMENRVFNAQHVNRVGYKFM